MTTNIINIYRWNYFTQTLLSTFISTYLPVLLTVVRGFSPMEVSFIILGQIPLLFKPIVGYLSEKQKERGESIRKSIRKDSKENGEANSKGESGIYYKTRSAFHRRVYLVGGSMSFIVSFFILGIVLYSASFWVLFGMVFLGHSGQAVTDMAADAIVLDHQSKTTKYKASGNMRIFSVLGLPVSMVLYNLTVSSSLLSGWRIFIIITGSLAVPTLYFGYAYSPARHPASASADRDNANDLPPTSGSAAQPSPEPTAEKDARIPDTSAPSTRQKSILKRNRILLVVFMLCINAPGLIDMLNEPYLIQKFGESAFDKYVLIGSISMIAGLPIIYLLYKRRDWVEERRPSLIIGAGIFFIFYYYLLNFGSLNQILATLVVLSPLQNVVNFLFITILMDLTPGKKRAMWYQIFGLIYAGAGIGYRFLGPIVEAKIGFGWTSAVIVLILAINIPVLAFMNKGMKYKKVYKEPGKNEKVIQGQ